MITLRFDMRAPATAAPTTELYAAAIEMCAWAETRGAILAVFSEHHGTEDGHPADENVGLLLRLLKGEPVVHEGRHIHVTPQCVTKRAAGGPYRVLTIDDGTAHVRGGRSLPLLRLRAGCRQMLPGPVPRTRRALWRERTTPSEEKRGRKSHSHRGVVHRRCRLHRH